MKKNWSNNNFRIKIFTINYNMHKQLLIEEILKKFILN